MTGESRSEPLGNKERSDAAGTKPAILDRLEAWLGQSAHVVALVSVIGMLLVAAVTMVHILLRWLADSGVTALNEIVELLFAVAITACIPAGIVRGVNLRIDLIARWLSPSAEIWLKLLGDGFMLLFYGPLAWRIWTYAERLQDQGRTTVILGLPLAPFMDVVAALLAFATLVQAVIAINAGRRCFALVRRERLKIAVPVGAVTVLA